MTIDQMVYFQVIARKKSLNKAAEVLYISQPALTKQVKLLEKELEVSLLVRSKNGVSLTKEGEVFLKEINEILYKVNGIKEKVTGCRTKKQLMKIGALPSIGVGFLPHFIKKLQPLEIHFDITISDTSKEINDLLVEGKIDIGFVQDRLDSDHCYELFTEPYYLVVPRSHFFVNLPSISFEQLHDIPIILPKPPCDIRISLNEYLNKYSISLHKVMEVSSNDSILSLVKNNMGLAIIPAMTAPTLEGSLKAIPINNTGFDRKVSFITFSEEIKTIIRKTTLPKDNNVLFTE